MTFNFEVSNDGGTTAYLLQTSAVSAGVATLSTKQYSKATENQDTNFVVDFPLNYEFFRVKDLTVANGASDDDMSITIFLGNI